MIERMITKSEKNIETMSKRHLQEFERKSKNNVNQNVFDVVHDDLIVN